MKFIFQCYITLVVFCSSHAQPVRSVLPDCKDDNSLLWEVNVPGKEGPSYLFGTFHLLCKTDIRFSDNFIQALLQSDQLYLEMNLDDPSVMLGGLLLMNMNGGKTLEDLLSLKEYDRLKHYFEDSLGMPIALLKRI